MPISSGIVLEPTVLDAPVDAVFAAFSWAQEPRFRTLSMHTGEEKGEAGSRPAGVSTRRKVTA